MRHFVLRVERAPASTEVQIGEVFEVASNILVVGRATQAHVILRDPSISSRHVTLRASEGGFTLHNVSERGSTWVDRRALEPDEEVELQEAAWVQLGRILLHVSLAAQTVPAEAMYSLPPTVGHVEAASTRAFLELDIGLHASVRIRGHEQSLFPMTLRMLWRLCQSAGKVVTHDELKNALSPTTSSGGLNIAQNITYIRDMFEEALALGEITEDDLRHELAATMGPAHVQEMEQRALLRALVQSIRGRGYRINLTPERVDMKG